MLALSNVIDAAHEIAEGRLSVGNAESNRAGSVRRRQALGLGRRSPQAGAIVRPRRIVGALALELFGRTVTVVGATFGHEPLRSRAMTVQALRLEVRFVRAAFVGPFVPVQPQPPQSVDDAGDHLP